MKLSYLVTSISLLIPVVASADDDLTLNDQANFDHGVAPLSNAIEIGVSTGYSQGAGPVGNTMAHLEDVARAGASAEVEATYRINPIVAVGVYGQFGMYDNGHTNSGDDVFGAGAGIMATAHIRPGRSIDPWVSLSGGWKGLWLDHTRGETTSLQGFDLARLQLGLDYRVSPEVAIAPMIGASLSMFVSEKSDMTNGYDEIADKKVNFTGFAGLSGRFGVGL